MQKTGQTEDTDLDFHVCLAMTKLECSKRSTEFE